MIAALLLIVFAVVDHGPLRAEESYLSLAAGFIFFFVFYGILIPIIYLISISFRYIRVAASAAYSVFLSPRICS